MNFPGAVAANIAANVTTSGMSLATAGDAGNIVYQTAVVCTGAYALSWAMRKVMKWKPADLTKFEIDDFMKLVGVMALSTYARNQLVTAGVVPNEMFKPPTATAGATSGARTTSS
jgi:hypothetical protein